MSRANTIAVVAPRHAVGDAIGGAETLLRALALRAAAAGRRVRLLTTCAADHFTWDNTRPPGVVRDGPIEVEYFPVSPRNRERFLSLQAALSRRQPLSAAEQEEWIAHSLHSDALYEHVQRTPYDRILVGPYLFGLAVELVRRAPDRTLLVPCLHDEPFAYTEPIRAMFRSARGFLFNSEPEHGLARRLYGIDPARARVVGIGLDPFDADPGAFAARQGWNFRYLIYSGRREPAKATPMLIEYVRVFRERTGHDLHLVLTGRGPVEPLPFVHDVGVLSEEDKHAAMAGAVALAHPSRLESLGIVLLEAWMVRTPALVHQASEVLRWHCERAQAGLWFRHYPDFEVCLDRLLSDETLRRALGRQGREYVLRHYSWPAVEARLFQALDEL